MTKTTIITTTIALSIAAAVSCDLAECVKHSDCANDEVCDGGDCVDPGADTGGTDGSDDADVGGGDCQGYTFEAEKHTIKDWECKGDPLDYPLPDLTLTPVYTTGFEAEAEVVHESGVCDPVGSPVPSNYADIRLALAESIFQQCMPSLLGSMVQQCIDQAEDICTAAAAEYYATIPTIPSMTQIQGVFLSDGPCEGGVTFFCDGGLDETGV